ncbi:MAG: ATP-binding cassette domain-containing protein [Phycisphaerae bacterium]|jgi:oligopeptide/dipeptide ABC transporter ATP-binding protein|nr:ATP-binding cassette domain-containing protein [Phycisphaerae bacterium]
MQDNTNNTLLTVAGLKTHFPVRGGLLSRTKAWVKAVDGVDLAVQRGKTLGLVGESGSGKTTVGRTLLRLIPQTGGKVVFDGRDVFSLTNSEMRVVRKRMQIIFQDPVGSLNPRMTVGNIVGEPLKVHSSMTRTERRTEVGRLLERVGLAAGYARRYPHEFSGGQRQRIGIARALAPKPDFIVCDEPVSALDVSIQAQILNLLSDLQDELGLSYLFIAHNLAVVEHFAHQVAVMYLGKIVEVADRDDLYNNPTHPYTKALLSAVPRPEPNPDRERIRLPGEVPSPINPPSGCAFYPRCPLTRQRAEELGSSERHTVVVDGQAAPVVRRCTIDVPTLKPTADDASHCHACLLQQD